MEKPSFSPAAGYSMSNVLRQTPVLKKKLKLTRQKADAAIASAFCLF